MRKSFFVGSLVLAAFSFNAQPVHAGAVLSTAGCVAVLASPIGIQAIAAVKAAEALGTVKSREECLGYTAETALVTTFLAGGNPIVGALISGAFVKCACKAAFL